MAKSKETYNKREKEKKRLRKKQEKREKMEERKAHAEKGKSLNDMLAYIDEDGNLSTTPPDPMMKRTFSAEEIEIGVPKQTNESEDARHEGIVNYFTEAKGFGFISAKHTGERIFFHVNQVQGLIRENDRVSFEVERSAKGWNAVDVKKM